VISLSRRWIEKPHDFKSPATDVVKKANSVAMWNDRKELRYQPASTTPSIKTIIFVALRFTSADVTPSQTVSRIFTAKMI
jgi:hypothetical protein